MAALRLLLSLFEAGVFPGCSFVLTSWYEPGELYRRMAIFYSGASAALDGTWGYRGWRFIYVIEGVFTFLCALTGFYFIYDTPAKVKWLSDEEQEFLLLRAKFSAGGESGVTEETRFSWKPASAAMKSSHIYATALIEFTCCVGVYGYSFVLPTIINNLGYTAANAQAMSVPPYVFACICLNVMALVGLVIIMVSVRYTNLVGVTLFGVFITTAGLYPISPAAAAWVSLNCAGSMKRAIVGSNIYIGDQAPRYPVGFGVSIGMLAMFGCIWPITYYFILKRTNAKRDAISLEEIRAKYTEEQLADMSDLSPTFRYST
ncbi:pantothenate transporter, putative [Talaromyces stipitatus ATCC 10500]|uniref:Pantothenate transporter, putative n=1 Tax=Talaromyces stipitatus (strain ATCC 10500 / CBS 375.48 / QM 6759 / NRRL 1006) TaxID=441959 RepID=B8M056_TALSN|nr:pantothenate transporter, putative [Talaromyces stipitatus ATCC 10500]EED21153.1 pantothenate transporter, putative [Talaromyces stipitatus ATCC 10500]